MLPLLPLYFLSLSLSRPLSLSPSACDLSLSHTHCVFISPERCQPLRGKVDQPVLVPPPGHLPPVSTRVTPASAAHRGGWKHGSDHLVRNKTTLNGWRWLCVARPRRCSSSTTSRSKARLSRIQRHSGGERNRDRTPQPPHKRGQGEPFLVLPVPAPKQQRRRERGG